MKIPIFASIRVKTRRASTMRILAEMSKLAETLDGHNSGTERHSQKPQTVLDSSRRDESFGVHHATLA